ncbi:MAG: TerB family tellurite resistance protein [Nitrospinota bacterium]
MGWMVGAGLGFLMGGPLGAVAGAAVQHVFLGREADKVLRAGPQAEKNQEALFITYLVSIMTKVAMADGHISVEEKNTIHNFLSKQLRYTGDNLRYIDSLIEETERVNPGLEEIAASFRKITNHQSCLMLLDISYQVALSDQLISPEEQRELNRLALSLDVTPYENERIKHRYTTGGGRVSTEQNVGRDDYTVLGLTPGATAAEVKAAYRQMASQYHPDKVAHLGKELVDFANKKFSEINTAYQNIRRQQSF